MKDKILQTIKKYNLIEKGDSIVIGVSGGPDSICLLNVLNELKEELDFKIFVAHINHMIRKEADEETEYVKRFCKNIGVECFTKKIDVVKIAKESKMGTEEAGRKIRYDFFEKVLKNTDSNKIATAHNNNDKVETIIMNILRGSGISGLKGLDPIRENKFIKPLIEVSREEIETYCEENKINKLAYASRVALKSALTFVYPSCFLLALMLLNRIDAFSSSNVELFNVNPSMV